MNKSMENLAWYDLVGLRMKKITCFIFIMHLTISAYNQTLDAEQIYKKVNTAVVTIYAYDSFQKILTQGSGVVLNDKGWIVTNYHVYNGSDKMIVKHKDQIVEYTDIIGVDVEKDILILKIADKTFPSIVVGNSDSLNIGQKIYALGSPMGFENTITEGIISGLRSYEERTKNFIQISAAISHGSSGGAVVNAKGELIGISTLSATEGQNLNFAIPVNEVLKIYQKEGVAKNELTAADYFYKGYNDANTGYYKEAIMNYNKVITLSPNKPNVYYNRGLAKYYLKDDEGAIQDYTKAIELENDFEEAYNGRGNAKLSLEDYRGAIQDFNKAIELENDNAIAYSNRGSAKKSLEDYLGAIQDYDKAIELENDFAEVYSNRGNAKRLLEDYQGAIQDFNKAIELKNGLAVAYSNRGLAKSSLEDYRGAILDYTKAIELKNDDADVYFNRGLAKYYLEDLRGSIQDYNKVIELKNDDADAYLNRGIAKLILTDKEGACNDLSKAGELGSSKAYEAIKKYCK